MEENEEEITKIRKKILSRNPHAFGEKVKVNEDSSKLELVKYQKPKSAKLKHVKG